MKTEPTLQWENATAYDFFISLHVLHNPDKFGLRGSWAAGVRSRLPTRERKTLEQADLLFWVPLHWIHTLPDPKNGQVVLDALAAIPPAERLPALALRPSTTDEQRALLLDVRARAGWGKEDMDQLKAAWKQRGHQARQPALETVLDGWASAADTGADYLDALQVYYEVFFAEEERRIYPALERALEDARRLAKKMDITALIEELSQGVRFEPPLIRDQGDLVLVPSFWTTPLVIYDHLSPERWIFVFGGRPEEASLVPGDLVPDAMLHALKALADPTRLRILRYLMDKPLTPSQLARRLRLRAPTVVHHLNELRLAGLVQLTVDTPERKGDRRYAARAEAIPRVFDALQAFLSQAEYEKTEELLTN
jgi:DNA-binding transcriptional ArsR family regulator